MNLHDHREENKQKSERVHIALDFGCPYWEPDVRSCLLVSEGIFLPANAHITTYCLTNQYALCAQYGQLAAQDKRSEQAGTAFA